MTTLFWPVVMAWRQGRAASRRLVLLTMSVVAGVAALVAINSFTANVTTAVTQQAEALLGADLSLSGRTSARDNTAAFRLVDSLVGAGGSAVRIAVSASFTGMAYHPGGGSAKLVQVRTVDPGWPFYGAIATEPAGIWPELQDGAAIVDPSLLPAIGASVGDTLALGDGRYPIVGTIVNVPGDIGLEAAFGQRVFIATKTIPATHLLTFGARATFDTYLTLPPSIRPEAVLRANAATMRREHFSIHTVAEDRDDLTRGLDRLGRYVGLVALAALLLGGIGAASAVSVFVRQRIDDVAVLRAIGATSTQIFLIYLILAVAMGAIGSILGVLLGVGVQQLLPFAMRDFLPVGVKVVPSIRAMALGLAAGIWTAAVFGLLPLLRVRRVPPLATLRHESVEGAAVRDRAALAIGILLAASVVTLATAEVGSLGRGIWFTAACGIVALALWIGARTLMSVMRRLITPRWPYFMRQGLANLHRPHNQTHTVILALGFGAFVLITLLAAQINLLHALQLDRRPGSANLVLFDIETDQRPVVDSVLARRSLEHEAYQPIVPMRVMAINGVATSTLLARDTMRVTRDTRRDLPQPWALRREYRSTYRAGAAADEHVTAGRWFTPADTGDGTRPERSVAISVEASLARDLAVGVGDRITWDVQGVPVYSIVASLRQVNWARFEPNFFVVFAPGALERAPQSWVTMVRTPDPTTVGLVEREIVERAANVTAIDIGQIARAITAVIDRIVVAIRFMALFSLVTGGGVLVGAIATSRWQRVREGTLLRTLGATRQQVLVILATEYAALGLASAIVAGVLSVGATWALMRWLFHAPFALPARPIVACALALMILATAVGLWSSSEVLNRTPLEVLRSD